VELPPSDAGPGGKAARLSILVSFLGTNPVSGDAGAGNGSPAWSDAYGTGFGGGAGLEYRLLAALGIRAGAYYQSLSSKTFSALGTDNQLSDFSFFCLSVGGRFYFLSDRPSGEWFAPPRRLFKGMAFFLGLDFGIAFSSAVTWDTPDPQWDYWEGGMIMVQEFIAGGEYRFSPSVGMFLELGLYSTSGPKAASGDAAPLNEAGSLMALRARFGLLFAF
jgi:hypothetical protein